MPPTTLEPLVLHQAAAACGVDEDTMAEAVRLALLPDGPDKAHPHWWHGAPCAGMPASSFYPPDARATAIAAVCTGCTVRPVCLASALWGGERDGWWGGTSGAGRQRLRTVLRSAGVLGIAGEDAFLSWRENDRDPPDLVAEPMAVHEPWPHQDQAVAAIVKALAAGGRCQVAIATAAGKTHVAVWSATKLHAQRVLVLVPSLTLVTQTADVWASVPEWATARRIAVCSDVGEVDLELTLDPARLREFVDSDGPCLVFATYQSGDVIADSGCRFDLAVADEAHHLAGDVDKAFGAILRGEISADRTLFMTATPRRVTRHGYTRRTHEIVGMDDPAFGPRVFDFPLSAAVAAGVVADYRVIVAAVERDVVDRVASLPEMRGMDSYLLAGAIAVVRAMGEFGLQSCLSFHSRVERARAFSELVGAVAEALDARPPGPGWAGFVHGGASVKIRRRLLTRLSDHRMWGVLANARAVGEGVDVPTLDAVAIVDPKGSETDVMQACGRALRRPHRGSVGTVILPVLLARNPDPADPLAGADERSLEVVGGVLRALSAHDSDLAARMGSTRRRIGGYGARARPALDARTGDFADEMRREAAVSLLRSRVQLRVPGGATGALAGAIALHVIREATSPWDEAYGRMVAYVQEHHAIPGQVDKVPDGTGTFALGAWATVQRTLYRRELLPADRIALLEAVPGWAWDPRDQGWWEKFEALRDYMVTHGCDPKQRDALHNGVYVGRFQNTCRAAMTDHDGHWLHKFPDRIAALEAIPGWVWNTKDAQWEAGFERLKAFIKEHGRMPTAWSDKVEGRWASKQRMHVRNGDLSERRVARLRALPGWVDDRRDAIEDAWEENLLRLVDFMADFDRQPRQGEWYDGVNLGAWVTKQRQLYHGFRRPRGGGTSHLSSERVRRLDSIPGWVWNTKEDTWETRLAEVEDYARRHRVFGQPLRLPQGTLSSWGTTQRVAYSRGELRKDRVDALTRIPGWSWSVSDAKAEAAEAAVAAWLTREGPVDPPTSHREDGVPLRAWIVRWRTEEPQDQIDPALAERLEALPGWSWTKLPTLATPVIRDADTGQYRVAT